jgi:anti-sigma regulatory factor (Ser/Thr protein kinase)
MTTRRFGPATDQIPMARHFVLRAVDPSGSSVSDAVKDDIALLTSEAVANAVEHARTRIDVTVERLGRSSFLVRVHEDSPLPIPTPTSPASVTSTAGRGLAIIDAIAERWGVENVADDGTSIWFVAAAH